MGSIVICVLKTYRHTNIHSRPAVQTLVDIQVCDPRFTSRMNPTEIVSATTTTYSTCLPQYWRWAY